MDKKERDRLYRLANREKFNEYNRKYKEKYPEKCKESITKEINKWIENNPEKHRQQNLERVMRHYEKSKVTKNKSTVKIEGPIMVCFN